MSPDPNYRGDAAKRILDEEGEEEEAPSKKRTLMQDLEEMDFGGTGLDEEPSDPRAYGVGE